MYFTTIKNIEKIFETNRKLPGIQETDNINENFQEQQELMILLNYTQKAKMISMEVMKMLFTLEPLMTDLISFIYDNVRRSFLVPRVLHIKAQRAVKKKKKQ